MRYFYKEEISNWCWVKTDETSVWFFTGSHFKYPSGTKLKESFDEIIKDEDWVEEEISENSTWMLRDKWKGIYPDKITLKKEKEGSFEYNDGENISLFSLLSFYKKA